MSTPTGEQLVVEARVDISFNFATGFFFDFEIERRLCWPLALSLGRACAKPAVVVVDPTIDFGVEISDFLSF